MLRRLKASYSCGGRRPKVRQGRRLTSAEDVRFVRGVRRLNQEGGLNYLVLQYPRLRLGMNIPHNLTVT